MRNLRDLGLMSILAIISFLGLMAAPAELAGQSAIFSNYYTQKTSGIQASIGYSPVFPKANDYILFTASGSSNVTSWQWNFGDGSVSKSQEARHAYSRKGYYKVTLTAWAGTKSIKINKSIYVQAASAASSASSMTVSFTSSPVSPLAGNPVTFTDASTGTISGRSWRFGDGGTSTEQNPVHTYASAGSYTVTLTGSNSSVTNSISRTITVQAVVAAAFSFTPSSPTAGQTVTFADATTGGPTSWSWSFGDGTTSTLQNPTHAYASAGSYTVGLTCSDGTNSSTVSKTITVKAALVGAFSYTPASPASGETVQFTDASTGGPTSWSWSFGDGTTSTLQNPNHAYASAGTYTVALSVSDSSSTKTVSKTITVQAVLAGAFSYTPAAPAAGETVQFTDASTGGPTSWLWNFGDTTTSSEQNPSHSFIIGAPYVVTLTISNGSSSKTCSQTVTIKADLDAQFTFSPSSPSVNEKVLFADASTGDTTSWKWDFGDGTTSDLKDPEHTFSEMGTFDVSLTVSDGSTSKSKSATIIVGSLESSTIYAASPELADVQDAVNRASAGNIVIVPSGAAVWAGQLLISKGIILKAESVGGVNITADMSGTKGAAADFLIYYPITDPAAGEPFRISGFNIDLAGKCEGILIENCSVTPSRKNRIDNNQITHSAGRMIKVRGTVYGVVDNNVLDLLGVGLLTTYGLNAESWTALTFTPGSADNWYYEDNTVYMYSTAHDGGVGGRYASRYNKYINKKGGNIYPIMDLHGNMGTGGNLAGMGIEVYGNTYDMSGYNGTLLDLRGGRCIFYGNAVVNGGSSVTFKVREENDDSLNPPDVSPDGEPQHVSNSYFWSYVKDGSKVTTNNPFVGGSFDYAVEGVVPRENVHFWRESESFDGTAGVGTGLLADRPAICTPGVAYWATDEQKLYRCESANVWTLYYVPYAYPHPLRTSLNY